MNNYFELLVERETSVTVDPAKKLEEQMIVG